VLLRLLERCDLDSLLSLYADLHANDDPLPARPLVERVWDDVLSNGACKCIGAFVEDALLASCMLTIVPNLTRGCRPYGLIENVVTHRAYRHRGLGQAVLATAMEHAWAARCYKVMLMTGRDDPGIRRFYRAAGFDPTARYAYVRFAPERP
jgi:GNAT superfamily N-acetyltransferase